MNFKKSLLESVLNVITFPLYVIDVGDYTITMVNNACRELGNLQDKIFCYAFAHGREKPCADEEGNNLCLAEEIKRTGKPVTVEHSHYDKNGELRHFKIHGHPVFDDNGNLTHIIEYLQDITKVKNTKELLIKSEHDKEIILNSIAEGIIYFSPDLRIRWANKVAANVFGLKQPDQLIGILYNELYTSLKKPCQNIPVIKAKQTGKVQKEEVTTPDGQIRTVWAYPVQDAKGKLSGIVETFQDITDQKKLEEERNNIQAQFIQAQKMEAVGRLAGGIAHDFNNILTTIIGLADLVLMESNLDESISENISEIKQSADRAASLTQQLLAFSRKQVLKPKVINPNKLIINMKKMLRRLIGEDILLETKLDPEIAAIKVDKGQIEQIIMNLVVNSRDAMPDGGRIVLETGNVYLDENYWNRHSDAAPGDYVILTVTDNGIGMDEEIKKRVFEPFFTTKEMGKGTGLGLSTVYGVVKQSEGFIYVYSEKDHGTTFKIYLPKENGYKEEIIQERKTGKSESGYEKILLVEDDASLRRMINEMLKNFGYTVYEATSSAGALAMIESDETQIFDLLLTDVIMPEINGRELAQRVIKKNPGIKVLFTSGYTEGVIEHHGVLKEGVCFISKPFSSYDLRQKIREVLDNEVKG